VGGTRWLLDAIAYWIDCDPGQIGYLSGTKDAAQDFSANRLRPLLERDCPAVSARRSPEKAHWKDDEFWFDACIVRLAGGRAVMGVSQHAQRYMALDELDKFKDDIEQRAEDRTKGYRGIEKILKVSTIGESGRIKRSYQLGTQERYHVPCPHCGHEQVLRWEQIRWRVDESCRSKNGGEFGRIAWRLNPKLASHSAYYECVECRSRIESHHKRRMLRAGRWIARFPERREHRSFHWPSLLAPQLGWDYFVEKHLSCYPLEDGFVLPDSVPLPDMDRLLHWEDLAEDYQQPGRIQTEATIRSHQNLETPHEYPTHRDGRPFCPIDHPQAVVMYVDVQHNGCWYVVVAFGPFESLWLLEYGSVMGLDDLVGVYTTSYHTPEGHVVSPSIAALDSSDGTMKGPVYDTCRRNRWWAFKNRDHGADVQIGKSGEAGVLLYHVNTTSLKDYASWKLTVTAGSPGAIYLPNQVGSDLVRHWTCEKRLEGWTEDGIKVEWKQSHPDNHLWDALVGTLAIARLKRYRQRGGPLPTVAGESAERPRLTMPDGRPYLVTER